MQSKDFPIPPLQLIELYTDENVAEGISPIPPEPSLHTDSVFGRGHNIDSELTQPPSQVDYDDLKNQLKGLNRSSLVGFLHLLDNIILNNDESINVHQKLKDYQDDIELKYTSLIHEVNKFRGDECMELLKKMLEDQLKERLEAKENFEKALQQVQELLGNTLKSIIIYENESMPPMDVSPQKNDSPPQMIDFPTNMVPSTDINIEIEDVSEMDWLMAQIQDEAKQ